MPNRTDPAVTDTELDVSVPPAVASALAAATAPPAPAELAGEQVAVHSYLVAIAPAPPRIARLRSLRASKAALAAVAAVSLVGISGAAAATGTLPVKAQDVARTSLTKVGIDIPKGRGKGLATAPGQLKKDLPVVDESSTTVDEPSAGKPSRPVDKENPPSTTKGATISSIAKDPTLTGAEKGAAVSDAASDGKSRSGEDKPVTKAPITAGPATGKPDSAGPPASSPGVTAPGRTTASTAGKRP